MSESSIQDSDVAAVEPSRELLLLMYRRMLMVRVFEQRAEQLHLEGQLSGPFHSSLGQEAVAAGVCAALGPDDVITSTHRGHGHLIAKGGDVGRMLAELDGRSTGYCGARGGSMHLTDVSIGALGENGIVGGSIMVGTGAALGFQMLGSARVAVPFFGDGAVGQGVLYECLNLASIWSLPVVFICEDNQYAHSFPSRELAKGGDLVARAETYGMSATLVDGDDALAVFEAARPAVEAARRGEGPSLIQARCYRWKGHNLGDAHHLYRSRDEVREARKRDPVKIMREHLLTRWPDVELEKLEEGVKEEFDRGWSFAQDSPKPTADELIVDPWG